MSGTPAETGPHELARARAEDLERLRTQFAFDGSAYNSFALARGLWRNGRYDEALAQFERTCAMAPLAPDAHVALIRAALMLHRLDEARAHLERAEAACPETSELAIHRAQLETADRPALARDAVAPYRAGDELAALFHDALTHAVDGRPAGARAGLPPSFQALWDGLCWLSAQPGAALVGCPTQVLERGVRAARPDGLVLECGVYFGRSLTLLAGLAGQQVHGFDSFQGYPGAGDPLEGGASRSTAGLLPEVPDDARLHPGWFEDSLPAFFAAHPGPVRLLHIDCDLYASTATVLRHAADRLVPGSVLVFDDFIGFPGSEAHEFRAWHEFAQARGLQWRVVAGALLGREVAVQVGQAPG